jgi:hypothetical protein
MVLAQSALHRFAELTVRLVADVCGEQLTCSTQLLGLVPMHSDSQQFVRVSGWFETFTVAADGESDQGTQMRSVFNQ